MDLLRLFNFISDTDKSVNRYNELYPDAWPGSSYSDAVPIKMFGSFERRYIRTPLDYWVGNSNDEYEDLDKRYADLLSITISKG